MSGGEMLRKAADRLRSLATEATPGRWDWQNAYRDPNECSVYHPHESMRGSVGVAGRMDFHNAEYIATMHPGVGVALAEWLDFSADVWGDGQMSNRAVAPALAVARAVLEDS